MTVGVTAFDARASLGDADRASSHRRARRTAWFLGAALLDTWVTIYQWVCFPIYGIARVPRRHYFVIDRHKLAYLNAIEKVNCTFCSYANGLLAYVREVAARTEQYWCPIKHARPLAVPHTRYHLFFDYGDAEGYRRGLVTLRRTLPRRGEHDSRRRTRAPRRR